MKLNEWIDTRPQITLGEIEQERRETKAKIVSAIGGVITGIVLLAATTTHFPPHLQYLGPDDMAGRTTMNMSTKNKPTF